MIIVDCINNDDPKNITRLQRSFNCLGVDLISLLISGYGQYISIDYNNFIIFVDDIFEIYEYHLEKEQFDDIIEYIK